ncbi:MAG: phage tail protein [Oscillospiraceae bacterium]|jgi:phage tail-like protein|nr:phage tail protein [Oscillospiraceae bacterium]
MAINYPYRVFRYVVAIDGISRGGFSEVSGMNLSVDPIEYREGDDLRNTPRKLPGLTKFGNVTFRWGVTDDTDFLEWILSVAPSNTANPTGMQRKNITVTLIDDAGSEGPSWEIINAWPVGYTVPDLSGLGGEVAIHSLEIAHEGLQHNPGAPAGEPSPI